MANIDYPRGLVNPSPFTEQVATRTFTANGTIFKGDPVLLAEDGTVARCADGAVTQFDYVALHYAATTEKVLCCVNPGGVSFEMQCDDNSVTTNCLNRTFDLTQAAGDTTRKTSSCEIDSSFNTEDAGCVRVIDLVDRPDNDIALANNVLRVVKVQTALYDPM